MPECIVEPTESRHQIARLGIGRNRLSPPRGQVLATEPVLPNVASGEPAAVAECLSRYGGLVWSLARRSCRNEQSAEDAVQDIFLKLWKAAGKYNPDIASESTFVAMIARRHLIDLSRKKFIDCSDSESFPDVTSPEMDAAAKLEINDEAEKAAKLLNALPDDQRNVIKLSVYDGLSQTRIAEATGLSLGTVKTHMRRGMIKLRQALFPTAEVLSTAIEGESS